MCSKGVATGLLLFSEVCVALTLETPGQSTTASMMGQRPSCHHTHKTSHDLLFRVPLDSRISSSPVKDVKAGITTTSQSTINQPCLNAIWGALWQKGTGCSSHCTLGRFARLPGILRERNHSDIHLNDSMGSHRPLVTRSYESYI